MLVVETAYDKQTRESGNLKGKKAKLIKNRK